MTKTRTPAQQRAAQNAIRAACRRRQKAAIGQLRCLCSNPAFLLSSSGPVCRRCAEIEGSVSHRYGRETAGSNRRGEHTAAVMTPFAFHAPGAWA